MKKYLLVLILTVCIITLKGQVTNMAPGEYKSINLGGNGYGDYTRTLILLHEVYNYDGITINSNYAIGTITALRGSVGAWNRLNIVNVNTASSYNGTSASITSFDNNNPGWKLRTCIYAGKRYLALEIPYDPAFHDHGYKFTGWTFSTGENMKAVSYESNGQPVNQDVLNNIQDFNSDMVETHLTKTLVVSGNVGIGTSTPQEKLSVNGKIRAQEIKVENTNWPDYVFQKDYPLPSLAETEKHIREKGHLPGIPNAREVEKEGVDLGEMNAKLLQKIEELTLYLIEKDKQLIGQDARIRLLENELKKLKK